MAGTRGEDERVSQRSLSTAGQSPVHKKQCPGADSLLMVVILPRHRVFLKQIPCTPGTFNIGTLAEIAGRPAFCAISPCLSKVHSTMQLTHEVCDTMAAATWHAARWPMSHRRSLWLDSSPVCKQSGLQGSGWMCRPSVVGANAKAEELPIACPPNLIDRGGWHLRLQSRCRNIKTGRRSGACPSTSIAGSSPRVWSKV